jgi:hypothetical protein
MEAWAPTGALVEAAPPPHGVQEKPGQEVEAGTEAPALAVGAAAVA